MKRVLASYDSLLERYMPPSLLVSPDREVLHVFGGASRFLQVREGRPSSDLLDVLAAELKLQDVMLSSQTLSGAAGRALADELRHALDFRQPGLPPESRARRLSVGDRPARARRLSAGAGGGENAAAVTSLTGAHARELARELAERLAKAEAMVPAEREAAKKKSPPH